MTDPSAIAKFNLDLGVTGVTDDPALVSALVHDLEATARRHGMRISTTAVLNFDPPDLHDLDLGKAADATKRRSAMGALGIFTIAQLCAYTASDIKSKLSLGTLKVVRWALYFHDPRLSLARDDAEQFPLLIDSLRISGQVYGQLRNRGITRISDLTDQLIATFELRWALTRHEKDFPDHPPAWA